MHVKFEVCTALTLFGAIAII